MIVIVGESGCGKSTLVDAFISKHDDYHKVVTYTTRPMRDGESDGIDYHFISTDKFKEYISQKFFAEYGVYRNWFYGSGIEDCANSEKNIAVLTPAGARALRRSGVQCTIIYMGDAA